ncbi:glycine oxidase ThiO [Rhodococcus rhodnii]|nr:glycine oxidase ThiO [Rhodococcus rhodnii]TXG92929.1 glycine oxidase ThiO [Rhodococcus rhodnii]
MHSNSGATVSVVGGGVIGLACAWRAAQAGWHVTLHDPAVGSGASHVAGGMLAPLSEGWPGEEAALAVGAASLDRWPGFGGELERASGLSLFTTTDSLTVALDAADAEDLHTIAEFLGRAGRTARVLTRREVREHEPMLARGIRLGLLTDGESAVDNRALLTALRGAAADAGVEIRGEQVADLDALESDRVVLAAGHASARLWPGLQVRPVKGEILRLRARPGVTPAPTRTVRGVVHGRPAYLVPRADGIVVGATQLEAGEDTQVTVAGVRDLVADAEALMPAIGEYEFHEAAAGLRPCSPDNIPIVGAVSDRVVVATGHGRNGILMTPVTADAVVAALAGDELPEMAPASPTRFAVPAR